MVVVVIVCVAQVQRWRSQGGLPAARLRDAPRAPSRVPAAGPGPGPGPGGPELAARALPVERRVALLRGHAGNALQLCVPLCLSMLSARSLLGCLTHFACFWWTDIPPSRAQLEHMTPQEKEDDRREKVLLLPGCLLLCQPVFAFAEAVRRREGQAPGPYSDLPGQLRAHGSQSGRHRGGDEIWLRSMSRLMWLELCLLCR